MRRRLRECHTGLLACAIGLTLLTAACGESGQGGEEGSHPNVLLVVLDTTRADMLSAYGGQAPTSPRLEQLAREGVRFEKAFSTDFWTVPSHASLFTGQYPSEHGATSESTRLRDEAVTLAETLAAHGYRTAAFVSNPWLSSENGFAQGFERFEEMWRGRTRLGMADRQGVAETARFIAERAASDEPFFAFVNLNFAHMPYMPDPVILDQVTERWHSVERTRRLKKVVGTWEYLAGAYDLEEGDFEILRDLYRGELRMTDGFLGEIIDALRENGVLDDTLVIVTADHGENIGDHGLIDHMLSMYDTTIRVPLVMRHPALVPPGRVVDELVSLVDIVPTVLDAVGLEPPVGSGRSLLRPTQPPEFVIAENDRPLTGMRMLELGFPDFDTSTVDGTMRMIRTDRFKLIESRNGLELYDLEADPGESRDIGPEQPEVRDRLHAQLQAWMAERQASPRSEAPVLAPRDEEALEQLRALGYVE